MATGKGSPPGRGRARPWLRVMLRRALASLDPLLGPLVPRVYSEMGRRVLVRLPVLPRAIAAQPPAPWSEHTTYDVPPGLSGVPGIVRDAALESAAFAKQPLHYYFRVHPENQLAMMRHFWPFVLPNGPRLARAAARARRLRSAHETETRTEGARSNECEGDPALTAQIRGEARRLGLSAVGFAPYDPKYTFAEYAGTHDEGSVIVCLLEQGWADTQLAPSPRSESTAFRTYAQLTERVVALAEFVEQLGAFRAHPHSFEGETIMIHYAVRAGLGQLGLNGQLLTPQAGSRVRLALITTNMNLEHGTPVDYGIPAICDRCHACVRRCPVGAIPNRRSEHRGIEKAKIKTERCLPLVASADGCAVCMKVCPVQRYGLARVHEHWTSTGSILGLRSDELEGYRWPLDGRDYGAAQNPSPESRSEALHPPHWHPVDASRTKPSH